MRSLRPPSLDGCLYAGLVHSRQGMHDECCLCLGQLHQLPPACQAAACQTELLGVSNMLQQQPCAPLLVASHASPCMQGCHTTPEKKLLNENMNVKTKPSQDLLALSHRIAGAKLMLASLRCLIWAPCCDSCCARLCPLPANALPHMQSCSLAAACQHVDSSMPGMHSLLHCSIGMGNSRHTTSGVTRHFRDVLHYLTFMLRAAACTNL